MLEAFHEVLLRVGLDGVVRGVAGGGGSGGSGSTAPQGDPGLPDAAVLGTETSAVKDVAAMNTTHNPTPDTKSHASFLMPAIGLGLAALILLASERDRLFGRKH